jgi:hypothetical protein
VRCRFATWICGSKQIDTSIACRPDHIEDISNLDEVLNGRAKRPGGLVCMEIAIDEKAILFLCGPCTDIMLQDKR